MSRRKKSSPPRPSHEKLPFPPEQRPRKSIPAAGTGKKDRPGAGEPEPDYYKLKLRAVDDLVTASPENSPKVSRAELKKYHASPKLHVADWIKAILLKWWFAGVICYFLIWGLSTMSLNQWDHLLVLSVALGGVTNLLTNSIYRFMAKKTGAYDRWMMFPKPTIAMLPLDILYAALLILCTVMTYNGINMAAGRAVLGVEPLLFGLFVTLWDLLFLEAKRLLKRIFADAKAKNA